MRAGDEVLTFVNRNLEPYRGYHIFMRALPEILRARPKAQVVIVGGDEVSYGAPPKDGKGWKDLFLTRCTTNSTCPACISWARCPIRSSWR